MYRIGIGIFFIALTAIMGDPCYCWESDAGVEETDTGVEVDSISGKIVAIDWVASIIVVRIMRSGLATSDELTFKVSQETKITKGADNVSLCDLNQEDRVTVEFVNKGFSGLQAIHITVKI